MGLKCWAGVLEKSCRCRVRRDRSTSLSTGTGTCPAPSASAALAHSRPVGRQEVVPVPTNLMAAASTAGLNDMDDIKSTTTRAPASYEVDSIHTRRNICAKEAIEEGHGPPPPRGSGSWLTEDSVGSCGKRAKSCNHRSPDLI